MVNIPHLMRECSSQHLTLIVIAEQKYEIMPSPGMLLTIAAAKMRELPQLAHHRYQPTPMHSKKGCAILTLKSVLNHCLQFWHGTHVLLL